MAKFRIRLITPNNDSLYDLNSLNQQETFLSAIITDFNDQEATYKNNQQAYKALSTSTTKTICHPHSYTYNEKFSLHTNGQKELSFNIDDKIFSNNEWIENPFARLLRVGTQLELVDKYNNYMLFTVNKVSYTFNNLNIIYNINCQDSFTYQLTRQNQGYNLTNDAESKDFIGALDIDNWTGLITKDCYLTYQYVPLDTGIYQDTTGHIHTFEGIGDDIVVKFSPTLTNVNKIIKPIYNKADFPEYYETFPFSASGSNALAALIDLAKTLGLQLNIVEGLKESIASESEEDNNKKPIEYTRLFYFGPTKNPETTGLTYSPLRDVQNFSLNFSGDALTTVLNIHSTTNEDEEISVFPKMPHFFISRILTDDTWIKSKYYPGYFIDLITGQRYSDVNIFSDFHQIQDNDHWISFFLVNKEILTFWPQYYNKISLRWDAEHLTNFMGTNDLYSPEQYEMGIAVFKPQLQLNYSIYNILNTSTATEDWQVGIAKQISSNIKLSSSLHNYIFSITYNSNQYIGNIIPYNGNYYIYFLQQIEDGLYQYTNIIQDNGFLNFLENNQDIYYVSRDYWGAIEDEKIYYPEYSSLPDDIINQYNQNEIDLYFYIKNTEQVASGQELQAQQAYILLTRDISKEEEDFALIAEQCPWLENKIIDFTYFYKIGIISRNEYENLLNFITNDLRIINGQLMCYATAYYESLHKQTRILADLQAETDKLGAIFYANIVEPFATSGNSKLNTGDFIEQYHHLFNYIQDTNNKEPLLKLNTIISNYFNKYFNAEQRFLKNIYNFRHFFEERNIFGTKGEDLLKTIKYEIKFSSTQTNKQVGFNEILKFSPLTQSTPGVISKDGQFYTDLKIYQWQNGHYVSKKIPNIDNYKEFYVSQKTADQVNPLNHNVAYNPKNKYYLIDSDFEDIFPNENLSDFETISYNSHNYVLLDYLHIIKVFLYQNPNKYYIRDTETKVPFEWIRCNCDTIKQACSIHLWPGLETINKYISIQLDQNTENLTDKLFETFWSYYKALIPINGLYIQSYNLQVTQDTNGNKIWKIYDENNYPYQYISGVWYQYNLLTQSYDIPITYDKMYRPFFEVPFLNFKGNLSSIFSEENTTAMSIIDLFNIGNSLNSWAKTANYYTKVKKFDWNAFWSGTYNSINYQYLPSNYNTLTPWYVAWENSNRTEYALPQYIITSGSWESDAANKKAPSVWSLGDTSQHYKGDSVFVNFLQSATSELEMKDDTKSFVNSTTISNLYGSSAYSKINYKQYANYYKHIVVTYSTGSFNTHDTTTDLKDNYLGHMPDYDCIDTYKLARKSSTVAQQDFYWTQNSYGRFCTKNTIINPDDQYIWVKAGQGNYGSNFIPHVKFVWDSEDETYKPAVTERFSAIKFYPLVSGKDQIDLTNFFTIDELNHYNFTIKDLLDRVALKTHTTFTLIENNNYVFAINSNNTTSYYCLIHLEPYEKGIISNGDSEYINPNRYTINFNDITFSSNIYSLESDRKITDITIDTTELDWLVDVEEDEDLVLVGDLDDTVAYSLWTNSLTHWYATDDVNSRVYTLSQSFNVTSTVHYYYLNTNTFETTELVSSNWTEVSPNFTVFLHEWEVSSNGELLFNNNTQSYTIEGNFKKSEEVSGVSTYTTTINGINVLLKRTVLNTENIGILSNGDFWYRFHQESLHKNLLEKTILIETQLTQYWNQAYTASQYCQWFLPPNWQLELENKTNYFAKLLYSNDYNGHLKLSCNLIPEVEIYQVNNEIKLPAYIYYYGNSSELNNSDCFLENIVYLKDNPAINQAINHILPEEDTNTINLLNFTAKENGTTTYYYQVNGGWRYKEVLQQLNNKEAIYEKFDGLYPMQLFILLNRYTETAASLYETTLNKKLLIWKSLYARFPGIFLENTYENKDARSSQQLLQMAKLAFQDYMSPEKQYNITLIDIKALEGYVGQELHIGDSILLKASDYYDAVDETYRALNQYLFISDINYTLRQDTDIALTVNTIKYQDKLLQSIVKLIR